MQWSTHDEDTDERINSLTRQLADAIGPATTKGIDSPAFREVASFDEARELIRTIRRSLMFNLLSLETHEHWLDDCGDDTQLLTDAWAMMRQAYFDNDLDEEATVVAVNKAVHSLNALYSMEEDSQ